jgi:hypothetical protein
VIDLIHAGSNVAIAIFCLAGLVALMWICKILTKLERTLKENLNGQKIER